MQVLIAVEAEESDESEALLRGKEEDGIFAVPQSLNDCRFSASGKKPFSDGCFELTAQSGSAASKSRKTVDESQQNER